MMAMMLLLWKLMQSKAKALLGVHLDSSCNLEATLATGVIVRMKAGCICCRPKAVFYSTASQLGIHKTPGIPSLADAVLPTNASKLQRRYIENLLLNPPTHDVASSIRRACSLLSGET